MTILKRGNSKFWYIQFQLGGRTIIRSSRTTSRKIAEQLEAELRSRVHAEQYLGHKPSLTIEQALTQFVESKTGTPNYRNLCVQRRTVLKILRGSKLLETLSSEELEQYRRKRMAAGVCSQTLLHGLNLIRSASKLAKCQGYRVPDLNFPTVKIDKGRIRYLSTEEEQRLLKELDPSREGKGLRSIDQRSAEMKRTLQDCYDLVVFLLDTGGRYSEIANLEWRQIDLDQRLIRLWRPKVQNEAILFMTDRVYHILQRRRHAATHLHVFINRKGKARGYAAQSIRKAFKRAELADCTIHTLRHTHATRLIQNGLSLYEVRAVLGHSDIKTTMRYAHLEQAQVTVKARDVINTLNRAAIQT